MEGARHQLTERGCWLARHSRNPLFSKNASIADPVNFQTSPSGHRLHCKESGISDLSVIVVWTGDRMLGIGIGSDVSVREQAVRGRARQAADHRRFRRIVVGLVDHRRMEAEEITPNRSRSAQ